MAQYTREERALYRARENTRDFSRGMVAGGSYLLV